MSSINDLINFEYHIFLHRNIGECDSQYKERLRAYSIGMEVGMKHRQTEIDELKMANHNLSVMAAEAESYSEYWKYERDKLQERVKELELINFDSELHFDAAKEHIDNLQKKIDEALDYVFGLYCTGDLYTERLENILKGDSND